MERKTANENGGEGGERREVGMDERVGGGG